MTSTKLLQLFASMSSPSFLLANETNHTLLTSLLESINAIIEHQYSGKFLIPHVSHRELTTLANPTFLHAILKTRKRFEALRSFTLESGQEEIERLSQLQKEASDGSEHISSPARSTRHNSVESLRSPSSAQPPSLSDVPEEGGAFAIGDDDDSEDDDHTFQATPSQSSPSAHDSRSPSIDSVDDAVPMQLRGMSEKARGKMPVGQTSFSRVNSMSSISSHTAAVVSTVSGFTPSAHWVSIILCCVLVMILLR